MRTRIKFCGIKTLTDALAAVEAGADTLGFVMSDSPRRIEPQAARDIIIRLPPMVSTVGVFVDEDVHYVTETAKYCLFNGIQLQGTENLELYSSIDIPIIKSYKVKDYSSFLKLDLNDSVCAFLFDSYDKDKAGGTGKNFNWNILQKKRFSKPFILAGGLTPLNVTDAIKLLHPYAVDVSSGIEKSVGVKDPQLMEYFVKSVRLGDDSFSNMDDLKGDYS